MTTTRGRMAVTDGVEIAYSIRGPLDGPPLLLCPGLGGTQLGFEADADHFAIRGRRVLCLDPRGHGESSMPTKVTRASFSIARMTDDILRVLDGLQIEAVDFVGNSLGGVHGLQMIATAPHRMRSLVTFGTTYSLDLPWIVVPLQRFVYSLIRKRRLADFVAKKGTTCEHARPVIRQMYTVFRPQMANQVRPNIRRYDYLDAASSWNGPILILRGTLDREINKHLGATLKRLADKPGFRVVDIDGAGHFTNLDKPDELRGAIDRFLAEVDARGATAS